MLGIISSVLVSNSSRAPVRSMQTFSMARMENCMKLSFENRLLKLPICFGTILCCI
ncbi:hypothetical protein MPTK1_5g13025 [Marchantia polymorpha subsp. ruderalis]